MSLKKKVLSSSSHGSSSLTGASVSITPRSSRPHSATPIGASVASHSRPTASSIAHTSPKRGATQAGGTTPRPASAAATTVAQSSNASATDSQLPTATGSGSYTPATLAWSNLQLLGFDGVSQSVKYKCELHANCFDKPNAKAMQILMHFLLLKIKSCPQSEQHNITPEWKELTNTFHHSFPCIDRTQARDFISCCTGALLGFEKGPANVFPIGTIRKSHFAAPQGERMYTIFWHLSTYALQLHLVSLHPNYLVPNLQLPSLTDFHLFPHLIKAMKVHIARQSTLYLTRLQAMEGAEGEWREMADEVTKEYQTLQAQLSALETQPTAPRIPGQPNTEAENERALFSPKANVERLHKLDNVKQGYVRLQQLFQKTNQKRETLNQILNGAWKPITLDRTHLDRLMAAGNERLYGSATPVGPLNFATIVTDWNDSLLKMQGVLSHYLETDGATNSYVTGLTDARNAMESNLKDHGVKLSNLRQLAHTLRTSLIPELEHELIELQKQLKQDGSYHGPIYPTSSFSSNNGAPTLIPPTPQRSNAPNLSVPQTPAFVPGMRSSSLASSIQTPIHAPQQRLPSRVSDSVRRASQIKNTRMVLQRESSLTTIADEDHPASPAAPHLPNNRTQSSNSTHYQQQQRHQHRTPEEEKFSIGEESPLISPQSQHGSGISPQFSKKLVFSPNDPRSNGNTPDSIHSKTRLSSASSSTARTSLSPDTNIAASSSSSRVHPRFFSPPPQHQMTPPASTTSTSAPRFLSPSNNVTEADEGLLGADELYYQDDMEPDEHSSPISAAAAASAPVNTSSVEIEDEDDEVVFGVHDNSRRKSNGVRSAAATSSSTTSRVDPNAPTPIPINRVQYGVEANSTKRTPGAVWKTSSNSKLFSPSYDFGSNAGLLDEDE